jgi:DNA-binding MarR family transcriptional regulator
LGIALKSRAWQDASPRKLTPTQGEVLSLLRARGSLRLAEVAEALAVSAATASDSVASLAGKKLVRKTRDPKDARSVCIQLTATGRREAEHVATWPDFLFDAVEALSEEEQAVFLRGLVKMIGTLQERGEIPVQRMCVTCHYFRPHVYEDPERPHHCNLVNAPFGDKSLQVDCPDHVVAEDQARSGAWIRFIMPPKKSDE